MLIIRNLNLISVQSWTYLPTCSHFHVTLKIIQKKLLRERDLQVKLPQQTEENHFTFKNGDLSPGLKTRSSNSFAPVVSTGEWEFDNVSLVLFYCLRYNFIEIRHRIFTLPACGTASIQRCS